MKTSVVLASLLFGSFAVAAPVDKRALVYTTQVVTETVVIYTTVYNDEPAATSSQGLFYEQPAQPTSVAAKSTSAAAPAYTPSPEVESSSIYTPTPQAPAPTPTPTPYKEVATPEPTPEPKPTSTEQPYVAPAPAASSAAAVSVPVINNQATTTGQQYEGVDITVYNGNKGDYGMCGTKIYDADMVVALSAGLMGPSTYNVMTGEATNPWCGQKIQIEYKGNKIEATIQDKCPGCLHANDIDLTPAAWKALTGTDELTRFQASWSKMS